MLFEMGSPDRLRNAVAVDLMSHQSFFSRVTRSYITLIYVLSVRGPSTRMAQLANRRRQWEMANGSMSSDRHLPATAAFSH